MKRWGGDVHQGERGTLLSEAEIGVSVRHESNSLEQPEQENIETGNAKTKMEKQNFKPQTLTFYPRQMKKLLDGWEHPWATKSGGKRSAGRWRKGKVALKLRVKPQSAPQSSSGRQPGGPRIVPSWDTGENMSTPDGSSDGPVDRGSQQQQWWASSRPSVNGSS